MDDEFDAGEGAASGDSSAEESLDEPSEVAANGGLVDGEHVSMRGELWSDEDESFEDSEAGRAHSLVPCNASSILVMPPV